MKLDIPNAEQLSTRNTAPPIPIATMDDAMLLAEEILSGGDDCWIESTRPSCAGAAVHHWRDQADGFFE